MKITEPTITIETPLDGAEILKAIERAGRTAYKSESRITDDSAERFVRMLLDRGHESPLEHQSITVRIVCDRGISHELVRHRLASYTQESTRYCRYGSNNSKSGENCTDNGIEFIKPVNIPQNTVEYVVWMQACQEAEKAYNRLLSSGCKPETARSVLPNCLKTEIVMTANLREWRHILKLRAAPEAHPDMQRLMLKLRQELREKVPVVFDG